MKNRNGWIYENRIETKDFEILWTEDKLRILSKKADGINLDRRAVIGLKEFIDFNLGDRDKQDSINMVLDHPLYAGLHIEHQRLKEKYHKLYRDTVCRAAKGRGYVPQEDINDAQEVYLKHKTSWKQECK